MDKDTKAMTQAEPSTEENQLAPASATGEETRKQQAIEILRGCYDPEIPVDIYELGLIYEVAVDEDRKVRIQMTLTSPMCPVAESLPGEVETAARAVEGISDVHLELVWDPPWDMDRLGEAARLELGFL